MQQRFQALEREFDLPSQSVHGEDIFCRVAFTQLPQFDPKSVALSMH
jgi:hypothetical protein